MESSDSISWIHVVGATFVFLIAAIVFYPARFEHPIRPVTRVNGEMRMLATAVFDYHVRVENASSEFAQSSGMVDPFGNEEFRFGRANEIWPDLLEFVGSEDLGSWPNDPFDPEGGTYRAAVLGATFILISLAEDQVLNTSSEVIEEALRNGTAAMDARIHWAYSPTNGSGSWGDLFRVSY